MSTDTNTSTSTNTATEFVIAGYQNITQEGDPAIYVSGELAVSRDLSLELLDEETREALEGFQRITGNELRLFRLVDEGPLLGTTYNSGEEFIASLEGEGTVSPAPNSTAV